MYLAYLRAENFRVFGAGTGPDGAADRMATGGPPGTTLTETTCTRVAPVGGEAGECLQVLFGPGTNVLVGENDSGKTAIIDAIRLCLQTTAGDHYRICREDFHLRPDGERATEFSISCGFKALALGEQAAFLELLTTEEGEQVLYLTLRAQLKDPLRPHQVSVTVRSGPDGQGPSLDGDARELLRATWLRPLRDAEAELRAGRGSRLAQILAGYPVMLEQGVDDFDPASDTASTLVGILRRAEAHLSDNPAVAAARDDINTAYLSRFAIGTDRLRAQIGVVGGATLAKALERLELKLLGGHSDEPHKHGLGYNNALFMAAELLLLGNSPAAPLLLIEEPEAHLHPQLQTRVMELLSERAQPLHGPAGAPVDLGSGVSYEADGQAGGGVQVIVTTHSPHLAAALPTRCLTLVAHGRTFALNPASTRLGDDDYAFLDRFLDATKANLFFARSVAIVEGDAEAIALPALAAAIGRSFSASGVSIVNVGSTGLMRYGRIFQRQGPQIPIRVACICDRDIAPAATPDDMRKGLKSAVGMTPVQVAEHLNSLTREDDGPVCTFVADHWTLEYDLAAASWRMASLMHQATQAAVATKRRWPDSDRLSQIRQDAQREVDGWCKDKMPLAEAALQVFRPLRMSNASKTVAAQYLAQLLAETTVTADDLPHYLVRALHYLCPAEDAR
ncbi:ATP-dependent nuclease [Spirillospora sp. NBC_01491]|uniref:ATP-dependent nuclease n=1 Tax=Spirillospora sp. NBC_01491 TaxID=2976007 RepID=UPI002E313771|nr:AAA family ATPase [Spirillospora sp. NBC_01491]